MFHRPSFPRLRCPPLPLLVLVSCLAGYQGPRLFIKGSSSTSFPSDDAMSKGGAGLPPWHMWGTKKTVTITQDASLQVANASEQLVRINYKRPDTWRWIFAAKLISKTAPGDITLFVNWNLTFGVGRASTNFPAFEQYLFSTAAIPISNSDAIFSSTVSGRLRLQGVAPAVQPATNVVETIAAQDIQLQTDFVFASATAGEQCVVEVSAYFAPNTHIRPDWMTRTGNFLGEELGGQ